MLVNHEKKIISSNDKTKYQGIGPKKDIQMPYYREDTPQTQIGHLILKKNLEMKADELIDEGWEITNVGSFASGTGDKPVNRIYCLHCRTHR